MKIRKSQIEPLLLGINDSFLSETPVKKHYMSMKTIQQKAYLYGFKINYNLKYDYGLSYKTIDKMIENNDIIPIDFSLFYDHIERDFYLDEK